jgi:excisionase family DNA binding protein
MAAKLFSVEEAAEILGISPDDLNKLREDNEIAGVRVGSSWKFKQQEIERYAEERASGEEGLPRDSGEMVDLTPGGEAGEAGGVSDVVLLSEFELGESSPSTSSTIIGKSRAVPPPDSDIELAGSMTDKPKPGDSDVKLVLDTGGKSKGDSDLKLVATGSSPSKKDALPDLDASDDDIDLIDLTIDETREGSSALPLDLKAGGSAGSSLLLGGESKKKGSSIKQQGSSSDLSFGDDDGISLSDSDARKKGSSLSLDDDDLVLGSLGGSGISGESGISLSDPMDSGLSLEEPLELGTDDGSGNALEPEATFELTPTADASDDDSSGSQVIALDSEAEFDDAAATMLGGGQDMGVPTMLEEDTSNLDTMAAPGFAPGMAPPMVAPGMAPGLAPGMAPGMAPPVAMQASYSVWNVLMLVCCFLVLSLTGMMMFDLLMNIWSWEGTYSWNSSLMNGIIGLFE